MPEGASVLRIGVDVGGTNTDAVLMDGRELLAFHKAPTSANISGGIQAAIRALLEVSRPAVRFGRRMSAPS